jgi:hypothetical protein
MFGVGLVMASLSKTVMRVNFSLIQGCYNYPTECGQDNGAKWISKRSKDESSNSSFVVVADSTFRDTDDLDGVCTSSSKPVEGSLG